MSDCAMLQALRASLRVANNCLDWETEPCCAFLPKGTVMFGSDPFCADGVGLELPNPWSLFSRRWCLMMP